MGTQTSKQIAIKTPREIVAALDSFIVGQADAKRAVAIALRNRWRRQQLPEALRQEVTPKNILMIGPTGVGKTEISRRLAALAGAPFLKVEATKFTEVGYVGRDVESIIRDLVDRSLKMQREISLQAVQQQACQAAEDRILDILLPSTSSASDADASQQPAEDVETVAPVSSGEDGSPSQTSSATQPTSTPATSALRDVDPGSDRATDSAPDTGAGVALGQIKSMLKDSAARALLRRKLRSGKLDDKTIEIDLNATSPRIEIMGPPGLEDMTSQLQGMFEGLGKQKRNTKSLKIKDALKRAQEEEAEKLINEEDLRAEAIDNVEQNGIVFLDEIDKIVRRSEGASGSADVSREGVQRDLLPLVEGCTVSTKYGMVKTDHILFIASGAFHLAKPSDLVPELQGRLPIRVELKALTKEDFKRILTEPNASLTEQYTALMGTEKVNLGFAACAIDRLAEIAFQVNDRTENIGARRLHTILERLLENISFDASEQAGEKLVVDAAYVDQQLEQLVEDEDLSRWVL